MVTNKTEPLLSVRLMSYNNEPYIREAVEGILMQQTNFKVEIVVGDDFSIDNTLEIIKSYKNTENIFFNILDRPIGETYWNDRQRLGRLHNFKNIIENCSGKYIALLDGDDYWTDPLKLQKQVDFLEANNSFGICFHNTHEINEFDVDKNRIIPNISVNTIYSIEDYILNNKTASCSIVFNNKVLNDLPNWFYQLPFGDLALILIVMQQTNRKGMVLHDVMGVYRVHENGLHGILRKNKKELIKAYQMHLKFAKIIAKNFLIDDHYRKVILEKKINTCLTIIKLFKQNNDFIGITKYKVLCKYYKFLIKLN